MTLVKNQDTGDADETQTATVSFPSGSWPTGHAFQINLVQTTNGQTAILAQSGQFNISSGGSSSSSSSSAAVVATKSSAKSSSTTKASSAAASSTTAANGSILPVTAGQNGDSTSVASGSILSPVSLPS